MLLFTVAVLASCSNVVLSTLAPADNWDDVIHGEVLWRKSTTAVIADAAGQSLLPPSRFTERPGLFTLLLYIFFGNAYYKWIGHTLTRARIFHESPAVTTDMAVLPGVLGCRLLRRTLQVRLETNTLRLPGGTAIFMVSRRQFMKHPG